MKTEKEIIYNILNTIRDAEHNGDERISERLMRSFLRVYRGNILRKHYSNGVKISDEMFQMIPLALKKINTNEFKGDIPKIIRFENNYGMYLEKSGITIPLLNSEKYNLSKRSTFEKNKVVAKTQGNNLFVSGGSLTECMIEGDNTFIVGDIINDLEQQQAPNQIKGINVDFFGVLHNPDDCPGYDWEIDVFPFPSERLDELKNEILRKEFGIMVQAKRDEVSNSRNDSIRYHDNEDVTNNG